MKKLFIIATLLTSTYSHADLFDNLTGNLNLSPSQSSNLRNGLSSILSGSSSSGVKIKERLSFNKCFEMLNQAKNNQITEKEEFVNIGYALNNFYSNVIEGDYQQFHNPDTSFRKFGRTLMRGITNIESIGFNSTTSSKNAPQLDYDCSNFMDIEKVSKVIVNNKECRKVDLALNAMNSQTKKRVQAGVSHYFCEGENIVKADYTGKKFTEIYEMNEIKE